MNIRFIKIDNNNIDYDLLHKWCNQPFVQEWFEQRSLTREEIERKYYHKLNESNQILFYIEVNNKLIGLFQYYKAEEKNTYEYDIYIGEEEYLNRGIGEQVVKKINTYIFDNTKTKKIMVRPCKRNKRACRCYEKCGFQLIRDYSGTDTIGNQEIFSIYIIEK